jgi:hypothetical protein
MIIILLHVLKVHKHYLHEPHIEAGYIDFLKNYSSYKILVDGEKKKGLGLFKVYSFYFKRYSMW